MPWLTSYSWSAAVASAGRHRVADRVGHLLDAADHHHVVHAAGDGEHAHPQRGRAGSAGRLDLHRLDAAQPDEVGDQRAQVLLPAQLAREHVAHVERVRGLDVRIPHGRHDRIVRQVAQRFAPVLLDRRLADADNDNVSHLICLSSSAAYGGSARKSRSRSPCAGRCSPASSAPGRAPRGCGRSRGSRKHPSRRRSRTRP